MFLVVAVLVVPVEVSAEIDLNEGRRPGSAWTRRFRVEGRTAQCTLAVIAMGQRGLGPRPEDTKGVGVTPKVCKNKSLNPPCKVVPSSLSRVGAPVSVRTHRLVTLDKEPVNQLLLWSMGNSSYPKFLGSRAVLSCPFPASALQSCEGRTLPEFRAPSR